MNFEQPHLGAEKSGEREPKTISVEALAEKLKETPKLLRAAALVGMLSVGAHSENAEAQQYGVTGGPTHEMQTDATTGGTVVTPREGRAWIIPPETSVTQGESNPEQPTATTNPESGVTGDASENENVSVGETYIDGKKITE